MATPEELINAARLIKEHCLKTPLCDSRCPLFNKTYGDCALDYITDCPPKEWLLPPIRRFTDAEIQLAKGYKMLGYTQVTRSNFNENIQYIQKISISDNDIKYLVSEQLPSNIFASIKKGETVLLSEILAEEKS